MRRSLLWGIGLPSALLLVVVLVVPMLVSGSALRDLVITSVTTATGARVELGEARIQVLPRLSVKLGQGRIAGTGAALATCRGMKTDIVDYAADIESLELRMALLPLLRREIEVTSVRVIVPLLEVTLPEDRIELAAAELRLHDLHLIGTSAPAPVGASPGDLIPADLSCRADLQVGRVTAGGATYDRARAEAALAARVIDVAPISAGCGGGRLSGTANLDYAADPWGRLTFEFAVTGVPAAELLVPWAPDLGRQLAADLTAEGRGGCSLRDADLARATLDLAGSITAGDGVLHAGDWLQDVRPYLGERQDLVDVRFRGLDHTYRLVDGRYQVRRLEIDGLDTTWRGTGWVGLDDAIDLNLSVKLPPGFTPDLGAMSFLANTLRDEDGRVQLDLTLTGRASKPMVGLDLRALKTSRR